jgi:branched-chain amino acid transport system substrate-binding protein
MRISHKFLALSSCAALFLGACQPAEDAPIKLGFIGPLTGDAAAYGKDTFNGVKLAVDAINEAGGINGKMVQIIAEDGRCTGGDAASAAQKLVNVDKVSAIIGGQCSGETLAAAPIAEAGGVVMVSPISSSPDVTNAGEYIFRDYPSDALKSVAMAGYFVSEGLGKVAVISENTDFAQAFREALTGELPEDAIVFDEVVEPGTKDYRSLLARLAGAEFDVFFPNAQTPATMAAMMQQFREQGLTQPAIAHDVADSADLIQISGEAVDGMRAINIPASGEGTSFEADFIAAFGNPQQAISFTAHAYDAANLVLQAMAEVGEDGTAIRDYLNAVESYEGVVGAFSFDANGDVIGIPYVLREVQNGKWVTIADIQLDLVQ